MNRGYDGNDIFPGNKHKSHFLDYLEESAKRMKSMRGIKVDNIDTGTWEGKRLRGELLILLKDEAGLKYREISEIEIFSDLSFSSLRRLYRISKERKRGKKVNVSNEKNGENF
jgi:hypothetical protein